MWLPGNEILALEKIPICMVHKKWNAPIDAGSSLTPQCHTEKEKLMPFGARLQQLGFSRLSFLLVCFG